MPFLVLDESSWRFEGKQLDVISLAFEAILDRMTIIRGRGEVLRKSHRIFEMDDVIELWNGQGRFPIERDLRVRLTKALNEIADWDEELDGDAAVRPAVVEGASVAFAGSIAFAHDQVRHGEDVGCLVLSFGQRTGRLSVLVEGNETFLWFVASESDHVGFYRESLLKYTVHTFFETYAASAFPNLCFADGVFSGLRDFSRPYQEIRGEVVRILSHLSDDGRFIFGWDSERGRSEATNVEVQARFSGYDIAPESSYHLADRHVKEVRTKSFGGKAFLFSWHVKIQGDRDRIHIFPPDPHSDGRVIVGIFARHLRLRGD